MLVSSDLRRVRIIPWDFLGDFLIWDDLLGDERFLFFRLIAHLLSGSLSDSLSGLLTGLLAGLVSGLLAFLLSVLFSSLLLFNARR